VGLFIALTIYVLLTPVVLFVATLYSRFWKHKGLRALEAKAEGVFWLTDAEKKDFVKLDEFIAAKQQTITSVLIVPGDSIGPAGRSVEPEMLASPEPVADVALAEAEQQYQRLCALPRKRRVRFVRNYGAAYGAPAGLIAWLISLILYSFEFSKGIFEVFGFYFYFPIRVITRTMLSGELEFVLSMSTVALAVAFIAGGIAGFMGSRLAPRPEFVTRENYLRYGN
jgi:hypothetical protein